MTVSGHHTSDVGAAPNAVPRPVAVVTGASSGIGAEFARELAATYDLVLVARRHTLLDRVAMEIMAKHGRMPAVLVADLCRAEDRAALCELLTNEPNLSLLVNNAGFGARGPLWHCDLTTLNRLHSVHTTTVLQLCHAALPPMIHRKSGAIINVASVGAILHRPGNAAYGAAKRWIISFTEGLHLDLRRAGSEVVVQALCPGYTYSEFHDAFATPRNTLAPKLLWHDPTYVVRESLRALTEKRMIVIPGLTYRIIVSLISHLPSRLRVEVEARLQ